MADIEVHDPRPLDEKSEGKLITLFHFVDLAIKTGPERMKFEHSKIVKKTLFLRQSSGGYLAINLRYKKDGNKMYYVDDNFKRTRGLFSIGLDEIAEITEELERRLLEAGVITPGDF